jgi:hypothetical protein
MAEPRSSRQGVAARHRRAARARIGWLCGALLASGCGGDAGDETTAAGAASPGSGPGPAPGAAAPTLSAADAALAAHLYAGEPRTPADFFVETAPPGTTGAVTTVHLKNSDAPNPGATSDPVRFELCTEDLAEAVAWSERATAAAASYSDLVEVSADTKRFELTRVPRSSPTGRVRHRVFRCGYLDRGGSDLARDDGAAGTLGKRPATASALREVSEYLWQFTRFNNADHIVQRSASGAGAGGGGATPSANLSASTMEHTIDMAQLTRAANAAGCDRITLLRWTHTVEVETGMMARSLASLRSFGTRREAGQVTGC